MTSSVPQQKLGQSPPSEPQVGPTLKCLIKLVAQPSMPEYRDSGLGAPFCLSSSGGPSSMLRESGIG